MKIKVKPVKEDAGEEPASYGPDSVVPYDFNESTPPFPPNNRKSSVSSNAAARIRSNSNIRTNSVSRRPSLGVVKAGDGSKDVFFIDDQVAKNDIENRDNALKALSEVLASSKLPKAKHTFIESVAKHRYLDSFIIFAIFANCFTMTLNSQDNLSNDMIQSFLRVTEIIFSAIFFTEMCIKILAFGFVCGPHAYLRDYWNILDFVVVVTSISSFIPGDNLPGVSILRTFRALRPLRTINRIPELRVLVVTIISSMTPLKNVATFGMFMFLLFGISGLQLWCGDMHYRCFTAQYNSVCEVYSAESCLPEYDDQNFEVLCKSGGLCVDPAYTCMYYPRNPSNDLISYDNIWMSFIILFQVMNGMNWGNLLTWNMESSGYVVVIFYFFACLITQFLFRNLMVAVVMDKFEDATRESKEAAVKQIENFILKNKIEIPEVKNPEFDKLRKMSRQIAINDLERMTNSNKIISRKVVENESNNKLEELNEDDEKRGINTKNSNNCSNDDTEEEVVDISNKKNEDIIITTTANNDNNTLMKFGRKVTMQMISSVKIPFQASTSFDEVDELEDIIEIANTAMAISDNSLLTTAGGGGEHIRTFHDKKKLEEKLDNIIGEKEKISPASPSSISPIFSSPADEQKKSEDAEYNKDNENPWKDVDGNEIKGFQNSLWKLMDSRLIKSLSILAITINTLALSSQFYKQPSWWTFTLELTNFCLSIFFAIELLLRIPSLPFKVFFFSPFNLLDVVIVASAFPDMISFFQDQTSSTVAGINVNALRVLRLFRLFRVLRVIKAVRYMESIKQVSKVISASLKPMLWVIALITMFQFIFAIIGMQLFGSSPNYNFFSNFPRAFFTMFELLAEDPFQQIASPVTADQGKNAFLFFAIYEFLAVYLLLNLFLVIILAKFEPPRVKKENKGNSLNEEILVEIPKGKSLFIFGAENGIRKLLFRLTVNNQTFERVLIVFISLSCILLALDQPHESDAATIAITYYLNMIFTIFFTLEVIAKCVACTATLYLKDDWNKLDAFIVTISILTDVVGGALVSYVKVFRLVRALRPLRLVKRNPGLKIAIMALFKSIYAMLNIMVFILFTWCIFAILGMSLFQGKFYKCNDPQFPNYLTIPGDPSIGGGCVGVFTIQNPLNSTEFIIQPRIWSSSLYNFDNLGNSLITLFQVTTLDDYLGIVEVITSATNVGYQPVPESNLIGYIFLFIFSYISSYFVLRLFVGVVYNNFRIIKMEQDGSAFLSPAQKKWIESQKKVLKIRAKQVFTLPSDCTENSIRYKAFFLMNSAPFDYFIFFTIIVNTLFMTLHWLDEPIILDQIRNVSDWFFFAIYFGEATVKIIALRKDYFLNTWNNFDFCLVNISLIDKILGLLNTSSLPNGVVGMVKLLRLARVSRMLRLIKRVQSLKQILTTLLWSLPGLVNVTLMLILFLYIFAILGMGLFGTCPRDDYNNQGALNDYRNFETFATSILTMFRMSSGDSWSATMYALFSCSPLSFIFFPLSYIFINFFFLNLFISVILENFYDARDEENYERSEEAKSSKDGKSTGFMKLDQQVDEFLEMWKRLDPKGREVIHIKFAKWFLSSIDPPLGCRDLEIRFIYEKMRKLTGDQLFTKKGEVRFKPILFILNKLAIEEISQGVDEGYHLLDEELSRYSEKLKSSSKFVTILDAHSAYIIQHEWRKRAMRMKAAKLKEGSGNKKGVVTVQYDKKSSPSGKAYVRGGNFTMGLIVKQNLLKNDEDEEIDKTSKEKNVDVDQIEEVM